MATLTTILSQHEISIEALIQKDAHEGFAAIVILTDDVIERAVNAAIEELEALPEVQGDVVRIRITSLQE